MASLRWHHGPVARESTVAVPFGGITILMSPAPDAASSSYIGRESQAPSAVNCVMVPSISSSIEMPTHASSEELSVRTEALIHPSPSMPRCSLRQLRRLLGVLCL